MVRHRRTPGSDLPDVVVLAEYHARLREARPADLPEVCLTAGALETARVPVPLHGVQQEPVNDFTATSRTHLRHSAVVVVVIVIVYVTASDDVIVVVDYAGFSAVVVERRH